MDDSQTDVLMWIATGIEKSNDILMCLLAAQDPHTAGLVDYIHNTKHQFMSDMNESQLGAATEEYEATLNDQARD